mgnify:CR=1 FL=1
MLLDKDIEKVLFSEEEIDTKCNIIITGGFAAILHSYMPKEYIYDENLNVGGLNLILDKYC